MRTWLIGMLLFLAAAGNAGAIEGERRLALVIGNGDYTGAGLLANTTNDAHAVAAALDGLGFEVTLVTDVALREAIEAIDGFSRSLVGADVAFLFYAGHGMQIGGQNFILPVDVDVTSERALRYSAIDIGEVVTDMERSARVALVVLDACRDNPYVDVVANSIREERAARPLQGLSAMQLSGRGAIVAYAAAAGEVASDGAGRHSPYTEALLAEIAKPGVEVGLMFRRAAGRVFDGTRGKQRPELLVRLVEEVYLNPGPASASATAVPVAAVALPATGTTGIAAPEATKPTLVADAGGQAAAVRTTRREGFFGNRVVRKPPWASDVVAPAPRAFRPSEPSQVAEGGGNDSFGSAQSIALGAVVEARISPRGDRDWYALDVPVAGLLRVAADVVPDAIDLYTRVWNADNRVVVDWQGAARPGGALEAGFALPGPGRYVVEVADGNGDQDSPDPFPLAFAFQPSNDPLEPNDSFGAARPIPLPLAVAPTIFPRGDRDWMSVWAPEPGLLTLRAEEVPQNLDVVLRLWDLAGKVVKDWEGPARIGGDTLLQAELADPGVYVVEMADGNDDAENVLPFRLSGSFEPVEDDTEPNEGFGAATQVHGVGAYKLAVFPRGDRDWLAVDIDHPGELALRATGLPPEIDLYMRVWNADKTVVRDWIAPLRRGGDTEGFADLPLPGRYFVEVADGNSDASSKALFDFELAFTPQPDQYEPNDDAAAAAPLTPGGEILFNILPRGDHDWFRIEAPAQGELALLIDEGPETLDLHYRVWDADRKVIRDWVAPYRKGGLTEGFADLPAAGSYFLEVVDGNDDERSIRHATLKTAFTATGDLFEPNDGFGSAVPLPGGEAAFGAILPRGDVDWYRLDLERAGDVRVTIDEVPDDLDIYVRLWDADGSASGWIGPPRPGGVTEGRFPAKSPGVYRLEVRDGNDDRRSPKLYRLSAALP